MTAKKWSDIRAQRFTAEELRQIDLEVEHEVLEMDLCALRGYQRQADQARGR